MTAGDLLQLAPEVAEALATGRAVVALESSLIAQGLPVPDNLETALAAEAAVRDAGAVPATAAIADGRLVLGADRALLERLADPAQRPAKAASRDIGPLLVSRGLASTTVSATLRIAHMAGVRVFTTGGIGGVHRDAATTFDISGDIDEIATTRMGVVCSGAKSLLDLPATLELLETRRVPVVGIGVAELPAFTTRSSGLPIPHRVDSDQQAALVLHRHLAVPGGGGVLFVQPVPAEVAIPADEAEAWLATAVHEAAVQRVTGGRVTPFILARLADLSGGRTLRANVALIVANAATAGRIAVADAALGS